MPTLPNPQEELQPVDDVEYEDVLRREIVEEKTVRVKVSGRSRTQVLDARQLATAKDEPWTSQKCGQVYAVSTKPKS